MSHLNFNIRAAETKGRSRQSKRRVKTTTASLSVLWTVLAVLAVAGTTFAVVWFA